MTQPTEMSLSYKAVVFVATPESRAGAQLANGLARLGATVALFSGHTIDTDDGVLCIETSFETRNSVDRAFDQAGRQIGRAALVVHSSIPDVALISTPLQEMSYEQWSEATHLAVKRSIRCLQAAQRHFDGHPGSIVLFGPALSLVGATHLVPLCTALEAQRTLVKAAARQWGSRGIRVNWLAISDKNYESLATASIPSVPEFGPPPPPLGRIPDLGTDAAALMVFLGSNATAALTGATLNIDGGQWMVP